MESLLDIHKVQGLIPSTTKGKQSKNREAQSLRTTPVRKTWLFVECELRRSVCFCYINGSDSEDEWLVFLRRESTYRLSRMVSRSNSYKGRLIENKQCLLSEMEHVLNIWMLPIQNCLSFLPAAMIKYSDL